MDNKFTELHCANCNKLIGYVNLKPLGINPLEVSYIAQVVYEKDSVELSCFCSEECAKYYYDSGLEKSDD